MQTITATFEEGVLKPTQPLDLPPQAQVRIRMSFICITIFDLPHRHSLLEIEVVQIKSPRDRRLLGMVTDTVERPGR